MGGNDSDLDDVIEQVDAALDALGLGNGASREALLDGVREALEQALDGLPAGVDVQITAEVPDDRPAGPRLRVVEPAPEDPPDAIDHDDDWVRVVRVDSAPRASHRDGGVVHVLPGEWQTVYRGVDPSTYRLACHDGRLEVALDGDIVDELRAGTTMDVQGSVIRVCGAADLGGSGSYDRVSWDS